MLKYCLFAFFKGFWVYSSSLFRFAFPTGNHKMIGLNLPTNLRWALDILWYPCLNQYGTFYMLCTSICFTTNRLLIEYSVSFRNLHTPGYWLKYSIAVNLILILAVRIKTNRCRWIIFGFWFSIQALSVLYVLMYLLKDYFEVWSLSLWSLSYRTWYFKIFFATFNNRGDYSVSWV